MHQGADGESPGNPAVAKRENVMLNSSKDQVFITVKLDLTNLIELES